MRSIFPGYGVALVATLAAICSAPGQTMLVSLLNTPLRETFGVSPLALNSAYTLATVAAAVPLVWVGGLADRFGVRRMLIAVPIAFGLGCAALAAAPHFAFVVLGFFLLRFLGQGSLTLVAHHAMAMWFERRLGTMTGIHQVALFAVWTPLPALILGLVDDHGWRAVWAGMGAFVAILLPVLSLLLVRDRPEDLGLRVDGAGPERADAGTDATAGPSPAPAAEVWGATLGEAVRTRAYWVLLGASVLPGMVLTAVMFDMQPLLQRRGFDPEQAASAVSTLIGCIGLAALPVGRLVDRFAPRRLLGAGAFALAAACVVLIEARSIAVVLAAMVVFAAGQSLIGSTSGATAARFFGRRNHGAIRSSMSRATVVATAVGPLVFGLSQRFFDGFTPALLFFAGLCVPAGIAAFGLHPPAGTRA
jgi:OFA family oxalate/formate antiporter-like MFS transporter